MFLALKNGQVETEELDALYIPTLTFLFSISYHAPVDSYIGEADTFASVC
jgi:hypothetical protein